jgi:hypothetical protein
LRGRRDALVSLEHVTKDASRSGCAVW